MHHSRMPQVEHSSTSLAQSARARTPWRSPLKSSPLSCRTRDTTDKSTIANSVPRSLTSSFVSTPSSSNFRSVADCEARRVFVLPALAARSLLSSFVKKTGVYTVCANTRAVGSRSVDARRAGLQFGTRSGRISRQTGNSGSMPGLAAFRRAFHCRSLAKRLARSNLETTIPSSLRAAIKAPYQRLPRRERPNKREQGAMKPQIKTNAAKRAIGRAREKRHAKRRWTNRSEARGGCARFGQSAARMHPSEMTR